MLKNFVRIFFILFCSLFLFGNIYFWTDESGTKHYTNVAPPSSGNVEEFTESHIVSKKLASKPKGKQRFRVLKIYDGDTIKVKGLDLTFIIRLVGIDSPETGYNGQENQPFSRKAKEHLTRLLADKRISIKSYGTGGYNRQLAEVFENRKNINLEMIKAGLAEVYQGKSPKGLDSQRYSKEEAKAKASGTGIWSQNNSYKSPRQWRKEHPRK
jgi:micrococcal nuclease